MKQYYIYKILVDVAINYSSRYHNIGLRVVEKSNQTSIKTVSITKLELIFGTLIKKNEME